MSLAHPIYGNKRVTSKTRFPPEVDPKSSRMSGRVRVLMQCKEETERAKRLPQALVHFVSARARLFVDPGMSGLAMRVK